MYALLEKDEETDSSVYTAYLRAQSDADLLDIFLHLDPERYPARVDAVRRETQRRHVLAIAVHTTEERCIRGLALVAVALASILVLLTTLLTPADVSGPAWPTDQMLTDGTLVSTVMRLVLLGLLRAVVAGGVQGILVPLVLLSLGGWLCARARSRSVRADVKRLALAGALTLCLAVMVAAAPFSSVPALLDPSAADAAFWARLLTMLRV